MSKWIGALTAAVLAGGISGYAAVFVGKQPAEPERASPHEPAWTRVTWPFAIDQWGEGRAYRCKADNCGVDVDLYVRPKIGFCNCETGVADDEELERVGDIELVGSEKATAEPGRPITVHWMKGRSRPYVVSGASAASGKPVLSLAFNNQCDVIVATVVARAIPAAQQQAALDFLNGALIGQWAREVLGLE